VARRRFLVWIVCALVVAGLPAGAGGADRSDMSFFPQAGILWQDLYPANFVDLDPGPGIRDFNCGTQTYDGHTGTDSTIRSFREMDIGVPVFAALAGRVLAVQDGEYDRRFGPTVSQFDNHVVLEHGAGRFTIYGHLRKGITLKRRQRVVAGQQLGWTASSGNSSWPHLHFTSQVGGEVDEPWAGQCNAGTSGWADQPAYPTEPYLRELTLSEKPFTGKADLPYDRAKRTGTFVAGSRTIYTRLEFGLLSRGAKLRVRVLRPDGSTAVDRASGATFGMHNGMGNTSFADRLALRPVGRWRLVVDVDGSTVADAPVRVVARPRDVRNRPPNAIGVELVPTAPTPANVVQCRVRTPLVTEDPDYDIVRYRYRWTVGGRLVRAVTSAALSDVLRQGAATAGKAVRCAVTPSDGKVAGPTAAVSSASR
jgi:murein DD-endopeptidase MepM/ murein hydrolase activator NlpD